MSRLQQCIDALEALKYTMPLSRPRSIGYNEGIDACIAENKRILSAEPSEEEIERAAKAIHYAAFGNQTKLNQQDKKYAKAALLTAFPPTGEIMSEKSEFIPAYEGEDMARYIMEVGFKLSDNDPEIVKSVTNVRNTAIIVTDYKIYRARPEYGIGFCVDVLAYV